MKHAPFARLLQRPDYAWIPFLTGCTLFAGLAAAYALASPDRYSAIVHVWGVHAWSFPFLDTETVMSAVRCLRRGVDVFRANPCDPLGRVYDYSPLWLLLAHLPVTPAWTRWAGLLVDGAFLLSLLLLPVRSRGVAAVTAAGVASSAVLFAVERGNNDLVLFVLAAGAATLLGRSGRARAVGYALALLAGLLKYYPMLLMALAFRERPRGFVAVAAASILVTALFVAAMGHDLVRALRLIPTGPWIDDMFGSTTLPGGLAAMGDWPAGAARIPHALLSIGAGVGGMLLARRPGFVADLVDLPSRERLFLLAGALLILGCFFTAQNIGYRATHLLLTLPAFAALGGRRRGWWAAAGLVLALLWSIGWRHWLEQAGPHGEGAPLVVAGWLMREAMWWPAVTLLIGCVLALLGHAREQSAVRSIAC